MAQREYSEQTARRIDAEIEQLLATAHGRVRETLGKKRAILDAPAKRLIEKKVVDRAALAQLIADVESIPRERGHRDPWFQGRPVP
jgi:cell division protease FtsH